MSYDELAGCDRCGFCLPGYPVYRVKKRESSSPRGEDLTELEAEAMDRESDAG